ncbi:MAG: proprotein convertase P-domain-containing protein [Saprospiraceae bacterium]|nr:proprotein convertase P-domain-containing protein [Saprospiraceae bacterium]
MQNQPCFLTAVRIRLISIFTDQRSNFLTPCRSLTIYFLLFFMGMAGISHAQRTCLFDELEAKSLQEDPDYKQKREDLERRIQNFINNNQNTAMAAVTIPVVFHVVHNGDAVGMGENLSDAQLMAQLAQLNADYGRTNSDAGNTPPAFTGVAANTMIQFCLATTDPNGQPTSGIVRHNLNLDQNACWNADFIEQNIVIGRVWNRDKYLNIFTVLKIARDDCSSNSILGYAYPPLTNANRDAAVHAYYTIGSIASPNPVDPTFGMGRTVTHEVGHWLNLDHIWGGGCGIDDGVADTPDQAQDNSGCPMHPSPSCGNNGDMFMNYMDYVDDDCMNMFSAGQGTRMMAAINTSRPMLLNAQCGMPPANDGYTCANAIEINQAGTYNAPGPDQGNGAVATDIATHANWYRFTPPMTGMIRIFTCGLTNGGNNHNHVYLDATNCPTTTDNVVHTADRGCASDPDNPAAGVLLENVPVTMNVPIYIEWDDAQGNSNPFTWTLEYQGGGGNCTDYVANDLPINIPDNTPAGVSSTVNVGAGGTITDVNIKNLVGTHSYIGALVFSLKSPQGTTVTLINNACNDNGGTDFSVSLDDEAANALSCPYNQGNTERPENPFSAFDGENPMGDWVLTVADNDGFEDTGSLTGWTLEICTSGGGGDCPPTRMVDTNPIVSGTYQASNQLTSMGTVGNAANVLFRAGNNVELKPNFSSPVNSTLEVRIEGCQ